MKVRIEFDTDNAAFQDAPHVELAMVLGQASEKAIRLVADRVGAGEAKNGDDVLFDTNGNTVGTVLVER